MITMTATFPSGRIFARNNNIITVTRNVEEDSSYCELIIGGHSFVRHFKNAAVPESVVFPIDDVLEAILADSKYYDFAAHDIRVFAPSISEVAYLSNAYPVRVISGASYYPFDLETVAVAQLNFPQPKNIRIYPNLLPHKIPTAVNSIQSYLAMSSSYYEFDTYSEMIIFDNFGFGETAYVISEDKYYLITFPGGIKTFTQVNGGDVVSSIESQGNEVEITQTFLNLLSNLGAKITVESSLSSLKYHPLSYVIDSCPIQTDEYYLRWFDVYGYTMHFKFKRMDIVSQSKIAETVSVFDANLRGYKKQRKEWTNELQLTSNLVDSDTFDWLKRISVASDIEIYERGAWRKVTVDEVGISGKNEQNAVTIKINIDELLPNL